MSTATQGTVIKILGENIARDRVITDEGGLDIDVAGAFPGTSPSSTPSANMFVRRLLRHPHQYD